MKRAFYITTVVTVAFLFSGSGVMAQQAQQFFDKEVTTQDGEELGTVERVIIDSETGDAKYFILSRGGLLGGLLGGQTKVTILREQVNQHGEQLTANVDFSEVQQLVQQQDQQQGVEILDQVLGKEVTGDQGSSIGTIDNLVLGMEGGAYAILSGENDQQYPIPLSALQQGEEEEFKVNLAQEDLQQAPSFQGDQNFPDLSHQGWQQEIRGYYSGEQQQNQSQMRQDEQRAGGTDVQVRQPAPDVTIEQQPPEVQVQQPQAEITVTQKEPEVQVRQQEPEVEIRQPEPQVTVKQQKPEVKVQTPEPQVQVQQSKPEIAVRQQEPQVNVERQGEPQVKIVEPGQQQAEQQQIQDTERLIGMNVQDNQGNNLGTVREVMAGEDQNYIIMSSADKDKMYPIPMQQIQQTDQGNLQASFDRQQLENAPSFSQRELDQIDQQQFEQEVRGYYGADQQQQE